MSDSCHSSHSLESPLLRFSSLWLSEVPHKKYPFPSEFSELKGVTPEKKRPLVLVMFKWYYNETDALRFDPLLSLFIRFMVWSCPFATTNFFHRNCVWKQIDVFQSHSSQILMVVLKCLAGFGFGKKVSD